MNYTRATTAALAAALLLGQAQSAMADDPVPTYNDAVIFGKVTIAEGGDADDPSTLFLSVTIPATEGAVDAYGNPATIWNLGTIMAGGVYDSFYNGGPGHFRVQNTGNYPAYVYVSTGQNGDPKFQGHQEPNIPYYTESAEALFGDDYCGRALFPIAMPKFLEQVLNDDPEEAAYFYSLAVSTEITGRIPVWRPLSWFYGMEMKSGNMGYKNSAEALRWHGWRYVFSQGDWAMGEETFTYLAYLPVGETQLFDLKFWAPLRRDEYCYKFWFPIRIEAAAFKLWDHDR